MKVVKTASGKKSIKISKKEWQSIGKKAGWTKVNNKYIDGEPVYIRGKAASIIGLAEGWSESDPEYGQWYDVLFPTGESQPAHIKHISRSKFGKKDGYGPYEKY